MQAAAAQKPSASQGDGEVSVASSTSRPTNPASTPGAAATRWPEPRRDRARNRATGATRTARSSGGSVNSTATSDPKAAASSSGPAWTLPSGATGSRPASSWIATAGTTSPANTPARTPAPHSSPSCNVTIRATVAEEAPRQRSTARVSVRASSQAETPDATPRPPSSSEASPIRVMNCDTCATTWVSAGAASCTSRMRSGCSG